MKNPLLKLEESMKRKKEELRLSNVFLARLIVACCKISLIGPVVYLFIIGNFAGGLIYLVIWVACFYFLLVYLEKRNENKGRRNFGKTRRLLRFGKKF